MSEQDLYFCSPVEQTRTCNSGATLASVMAQLNRGEMMLARKCLEYTPDLSRSKTSGDLCNVPLRKCDEGDPLAMQGLFEVEPVSAAWEVSRTHALWTGLHLHPFKRGLENRTGQIGPLLAPAVVPELCSHKHI
jgi:hypothetical protein